MKPIPFHGTPVDFMPTRARQSPSHPVGAKGGIGKFRAWPRSQEAYNNLRGMSHTYIKNI